jgi:hypothetical protein
MSVLYLHVKYEDYKAVEDQMRAFAETTHKTTGGFYHKAIRLAITDDLVLEIHGPLVGGEGHQTTTRKRRRRTASKRRKQKHGPVHR